MPEQLASVEWERAWFLTNPKSRNADRMRRVFHRIRSKVGSRIEPLETTGPTRDHMKTLLQKKVRKNHLLILATGDGTAHQAINSLLDDDLRKTLGKTPLLPIQGGNANNFAHSVNSRLALRHPELIIEDPVFRSFSPLECTINETTMFAINDVSAGFSAVIANRINEGRGSKGYSLFGSKRLGDIRLTLREIRQAKPFKLDDAEYMDAMYVNGPEVAVGLRFPLELGRGEWMRILSPDNRLTAVAPTIGKMALGIASGDYLSNTHVEELRINSPTYFQVDGEADPINEAGIKLQRANHELVVVAASDQTLSFLEDSYYP